MKHITVILISLLMLVAQPMVASAADPVLRLTQAEFLLSDSPEPPPDSAPWKPQTLPDNWLFSRLGTYGHAWYRLHFDLSAQPDQPYAAYIQWLRTIGAVYVNGVYVGRTGPFDKLDSSARAQLFIIAPSLLRAGQNVLYVHLFAWRAGCPIGGYPRRR